jgi:hypothetical protein
MGQKGWLRWTSLKHPSTPQMAEVAQHMLLVW